MSVPSLDGFECAAGDAEPPRGTSGVGDVSELALLAEVERLVLLLAGHGFQYLPTYVVTGSTLRFAAVVQTPLEPARVFCGHAAGGRMCSAPAAVLDDLAVGIGRRVLTGQ